MRTRTLRSSAAGVLRLAALAASGAVAVSCHEPLDTARRAPPKATLGDDVFGVLCDRVGASSLYEDHTGASYQRVCHYDGAGVYLDEVDVSLLPPVSGERAERARRLGVAKVEAMARWRKDLVRAVNAAVPDVEIDNVAAGEGGGKIRLHDAFLSLSQTIAPLYEANPFDPGPEARAVLPASTQGMGRLLDALIHGSEESAARVEGEEKARRERAPIDCDREAEGEGEAERSAVACALSGIWGRTGYRSADAGLGAARAALAYPGLRPMTVAALDAIGPGGPGAPALQALFAAGKRELAALSPEERAPLSVDAPTAQPNRPRTLLELAQAALLAEDDAFAAPPSSFVARRDRRGWVLPQGGGVPAPFADADEDGLADVDASGRFVDGRGEPLAIDPPFAIPGVTSPPRDDFGRLSPELYAYVDTSRTLLGAALRAIVPLVDGTRYARKDDPEPWKTEHEGLMYALAGSTLLFGDREEACYDFRTDTVLPPDPACEERDGRLSYRRFRGEDSPLADLAHAVGQVIADKDSDVLLLTLIDLLENHEAELARMMGAALRIRDLAREHDRLAAEGKEPAAQIDGEAPLWDEVAAVLDRAVEQPGLVPRLVEALASDALLAPHGRAKHAGDAIAAMLRYRDQYAYDPEDLNGPAINLSVGAPSTSDPKTPVDPTKPKIGDNRSAMERLMHLMHDTAGVRQCNKRDTELSVFGVSVSCPGCDAPCELFQIDNLAAFYLDSLLPEGHDKKAELKIKPSVLSALIPDSVLEFSSGIDGLTSHPTPAALSRLIYFGADSDEFPNLVDLDPLRELTNETTNDFISGTLEPAGTIHCPKNELGVNECSSPENLIRIRHPGTTFLIERLGLGAYLSPIVAAFAEVAPDTTGEEILIDLFSTAYRHWPGKEHGPECIKAGSPATNTAYCSEAGANTYEPLMADALQAEDVLASSVAFARTLADPSAPVTVQRGPGAAAEPRQTWTKAQAIEKLARIFFSARYAANVGMVDRHGKKQATWADGRTQDQLTGFTLLADALNGIDARFARSAAPDAAARKGQWERATSELVDALLAVEGSGPETRFKNRALPRMGAVALRVLREQLNARCPDRERTGRCAWAQEELGAKVSDLVSHPLFAAAVDVSEAIRAHEPARRELERFLTYLLDAGADDAPLRALLPALADVLQLLGDEDTLIPVLKAASTALTPGGDRGGPGAADAGLAALKALNDDRYDRYHAMDHVLPALVTPMKDDGRAPLEVFVDAFADVHRVEAASGEPLAAEDYRQVLVSLRDFLTDETRGLEQIYAILRKRPVE
ncbi:hypothetical protein BE21_04300 [Sorangium cellulosum]|uniref:Secreted protein n=1 Tax=Sorangium cellulosum TaxID=56 RepID=A0A150TGJ2_SORCE|nr:hypothetical protein BE21_04300 [Sorangium cellulosum]